MKIHCHYLVFVLFAICNNANAQNSTVLHTSGSEGNKSVSIGVSSGGGLLSSGSFTGSSNNVFIGYESSALGTKTANNTFVGYLSGKNTSNNTGSEGNSNVFIGAEAGFSNTIGYSNTFLGRNAGYGNEAGLNNVYLGSFSGYNSLGTNNIFIGAGTGMHGGASTRTTGSGNVFIGTSAGANIDVSNELIIHNMSSGSTGVPLVWGNFATKNLKFNVNSSATSYVEITGPINKSGLRLTNLKSTTTAGVVNNTTNKFLTVNADGDVVLENLAPGTAGTIAITNGTNTTVSGNGSVATPYAIAAKNIYTDNGTLTGMRTMTMGDYNLSFNSASATGGKIYIGETSVFPTTTGNYRLYVEGGILTEKAKVALRSTANWADYVFANDYKLQPLSEIESFIKENKHLPGISSAAELVKEGLDLGSMQAKQMEKIEELTLYAIEQDKTLQAQKTALEKQDKEIEELKAIVKVLMEKK